MFLSKDDAKDLCALAHCLFWTGLSFFTLFTAGAGWSIAPFAGLATVYIVIELCYQHEGKRFIFLFPVFPLLVNLRFAFSFQEGLVGYNQILIIYGVEMVCGFLVAFVVHQPLSVER